MLLLQLPKHVNLKSKRFVTLQKEAFCSSESADCNCVKLKALRARCDRSRKRVGVHGRQAHSYFQSVNLGYGEVNAPPKSDCKKKVFFYLCSSSRSRLEKEKSCWQLWKNHSSVLQRLFIVERHRH